MDLIDVNLSKINSGCFYDSEIFRTPYGDETALLRHSEHWRLRADCFYFYLFDLRVTAFLKKLKEENPIGFVDKIPLSTATKCHYCARLVEIGNNTITCGTCRANGKGTIKFSSYFNDVDCFNK
jgi:hypothetical protein